MMPSKTLAEKIDNLRAEMRQHVEAYERKKDQPRFLQEWRGKFDEMRHDLDRLLYAAGSESSGGTG